MEVKELFTPIQINSMPLKNRIICGPMTTNFAQKDGSVSERLIKYYEKRASGGAGLVIVEGSFISPEGKGYINQIGIHSTKMMPGLEKLADAIKEQGAKASIQIQHCGRRSNKKITGLKPLGPSAIPYIDGAETPKEMTEEEIWQVINQFATAAQMAKEAGFDGVDIHSAHGYLPAAFLSSLANQRQDQWGGSYENRSRFLIEVIRAVRKTVGMDFPISVKFSGEEYLEGGLTLKDSVILAQLLEKNGVDFIQVSAGAPGKDNVIDLNNPHTFMRTLPMGTAKGCLVYLAEEIKKEVTIPVVAIGRLSDPVAANQTIKEGKADLISLARPLLADPQWPKKAEQGLIENIRPCIACNDGCYGRILNQEEITCTVNPEVGREYLNLRHVTDNPKSVLIAGGGPAGLEAAIQVSEKGHKVILFEKEKELGGQLRIAGIPPDRGELDKLKKYLTNKISKYPVTIHTGTKITRDMVEGIKPDCLIVATGSTPVLSLGANKEGKMVSARKVLEDK